MALYFITGNKWKFEEVKSILPQVEQLDIDLPEIQSLEPREVLEAKLEAAREHHSGAFIVEDTSFTVTGMNGLPGTMSKWFLKSIGNGGIVKLSKVFGKKAVAKSIIGYSDEKGNVSFHEGLVEGKIVPEEGQQSGGFGWDPIFLPDGHKKTFGQMTPKEKNKVSMRRMAAEELKKSLKNDAKTEA